MKTQNKALISKVSKKFRGKLFQASIALAASLFLGAVPILAKDKVLSDFDLQDDVVVCFIKVGNLDYYYGFFEGKWQLLLDFVPAEDDVDYEDCDRVYAKHQK